MSHGSTPLHKVKIDNATEAAQWCVRNLGSQGRGWYRTGADEFSFVDKSIAEGFLTYLHLGLDLH